MGDPLAVGGALTPATTRLPWAGVNNALLYGVERIVCACSDLGFCVFGGHVQTKYTWSDLGFCTRHPIAELFLFAGRKVL